MAQAAPSVLDPLGHLPLCPKCQFHLSQAILCKGMRTAENINFWFRRCLNNCPPHIETCDGFEWDKTGIPHGPAGYAHLDKPCPGAMSATSTKKKDINQQCLFALCKQCCRHAHRLIPTVRPCNVSDHRPPGALTNSATAHTRPWQGIPPAPAPSGSAGEPARASLSQATPQAATSATPAAPPSPLAPAPVDSAFGRYQPVGRSHKVSISPGYLELVKNVQAQQVGHQEDAENEMRLEEENAHNVHVAWWHQDDTEPHFFEVRVKHWPAFHPKHCPELVDAFDLKNAGFQYFDKATRSWFNGSWDGPSRNVKTCGPLRYRTQGVTRGVDMPASSNPRKRQVAEDLDSDAESSTR
ncbi:hypothetical protein C8T65DRAFT_739107 [Cerioporus squamosus]|nr:hypothetical protein C8T65DRAFT_739107 [Cerioporus squamosus]